jgi:hypothetical protein
VKYEESFKYEAVWLSTEHSHMPLGMGADDSIYTGDGLLFVITIVKHNDREEEDDVFQ